MACLPFARAFYRYQNGFGNTLLDIYAYRLAPVQRTESNIAFFGLNLWPDHVASESMGKSSVKETDHKQAYNLIVS